MPGRRWSPEKSRPKPRDPPEGCSSSRWRHTCPGVCPGVQMARTRRPADRAARRGRCRGPAVRPPVRAASGRALRRAPSAAVPDAVRCARRREPGGQTVEPLARIGLAGAADHGGVRGVHRDPGAGGLPHLGGESVVVGVMVRDQDAVEIGEGEAAGADAGDEGVPGVRVVPAGVDEHRPAVGLQEVDEGVAERVVRDGDGDAPHPALVVGHLRRHPGPLSVWHTPGTRPSL